MKDSILGSALKPPEDKRMPFTIKGREEFLKLDRRAQRVKENIIKVNYIKIKKFCLSRDTITSKKMTHKLGEAICFTYVTKG